MTGHLSSGGKPKSKSKTCRGKIMHNHYSVWIEICNFHHSYWYFIWCYCDYFFLNLVRMYTTSCVSWGKGSAKYYLILSTKLSGQGCCELFHLHSLKYGDAVIRYILMLTLMTSIHHYIHVMFYVGKISSHNIYHIFQLIRKIGEYSKVKWEDIHKTCASGIYMLWSQGVSRNSLLRKPLNCFLYALPCILPYQLSHNLQCITA